LRRLALAHLCEVAPHLLMQKTFFIFCSSLARSVFASIRLLFAYPDPFLSFFFPSPIFKSDFSFRIRDPQQFTAAMVWGRLTFTTFASILWGLVVSTLYWVSAFSRLEKNTVQAVWLWLVYTCSISVCRWRWDFCELPLTYATAGSGLRDLSFFLRNAQGDFSDLCKAFSFVSVCRCFLPFARNSVLASYWRVLFRLVFIVFVLFFFGGNGNSFDFWLLVVSIFCFELRFFVQTVFHIVYKYKFR
jgi:hypothetical protein